MAVFRIERTKDYTVMSNHHSPDTENPYLDKPDTEKPAELNIEKPNTQKQNTHGASTDSIPFREQRQHSCRNGKRKGCDVCLRDRKLSGIDSGEHRV